MTLAERNKSLFSLTTLKSEIFKKNKKKVLSTRFSDEQNFDTLLRRERKRSGHSHLRCNDLQHPDNISAAHLLTTSFPQAPPPQPLKNLNFQRRSPIRPRQGYSTSQESPKKITVLLPFSLVANTRDRAK